MLDKVAGIIIMPLLVEGISLEVGLQPMYAEVSLAWIKSDKNSYGEIT